MTPGTRFLPNWHINAMAFLLEQARLGKTTRLIICMPPRSLKSIVASVAFPAFVLGHDPTRRLIAASYGAELAIKHASDCRAILRADWFQRVFPRTRISKIKDTESEFVTTERGYRLATSVDGTLTGRGGDIIVVDDPLKPSDALSDSKRERVNDWFNDTLLSRLNDKQTGVIVVVTQRLHVHDLVGALLDGPEKWTVLKSSRDRRAGGAHPARREHISCTPGGRSSPCSARAAVRSRLDQGTARLGHVFSPISAAARSAGRRYDQACLGPPLRTAAPANVISRCSELGYGVKGRRAEWLVRGHDLVCSRKKFYLIDVLRGRFDYPTLRSRAIAHAQAHKPHKILIEDAGVGTALVSELKRSGLTAIAVKPEQSKMIRMSIESAKFEAGLVLFPHQALRGSGISRTSSSASRTGVTTIRLTASAKPSGTRAPSYDTSYSWVG